MSAIFALSLGLVPVIVSASMVIRRLRREVRELRLGSRLGGADPSIDVVSGLPSRLALQEELGRKRTRSADRERNIALIALDLTGLEALNDSLGRAVGDIVVAEIAARLKVHVRENEMVARIDGDRFAVVVEAPISRDGALRAAARLMEVVAENMEVGSVDVSVETYGGVAFGPAASATELLDQANVALARSRTQRSRIPVMFEPAHKRDVATTFHQRQGLRTALSGGEFDLVYQPIHRLDDGEMTSVEALLRWHSPTLGSVSPVDFIPLVESSGAIVEIGAWVLDRACRDLLLLSEALEDPQLAVSVNVSAIQLREPGFSAAVGDAIVGHSIDPGRLHLEITESALALPDEVRDELMEIDRLGARIALDDVGTGYSSLAQLASFPIGTLKVDRSLMQAVDRGLDGALSILRSLAGLGRSLSLDVVAEGIETEAHSAIARTCGCTHEQGFLRSRPLPVPELVDHVSRTDNPAMVGSND